MIAENPKVTELKPYRGFQIVKTETFSDWGKYVSYSAYRTKQGFVTDYIDDCSSLKELKKEIILIT